MSGLIDIFIVSSDFRGVDSSSDSCIDGVSASAPLLDEAVVGWVHADVSDAALSVGRRRDSVAMSREECGLDGASLGAAES